MKRISINLVANFSGKLSTVVLGVAFVPIYLSILGLEGYGLIGIFAVLQSVLSLFDFGLSATFTRQLARDAAEKDRAGNMRDFTRTLETGYWAVSIGLVAIWVVFSPLIATHWINASQIRPDAASTAIRLMGAAAAVQFPFTLYGSGLQGLQRQVSYNVVLIAGGLLRSVGAVMALHFIGPTIVVFFAWQLVASCLQTAVGATILWLALPKAVARTKVDIRQLAAVWRFTVGTGGTAALGAFRSQVDKVLLTKLLPLHQFGNYALAGVLASSVYLLGTPFYIAYFPRLSELHAKKDDVGMSVAYHQACQLLAAVLLPAAAVVCFFSSEIIFLWTGDPQVAAGSAMIASLLVVAFALSALGGLPYTLQLACGWSRLGLETSAISLVLSIPLIVVGALRFQAVGTAAALVIVNGFYTLAIVHRMHRRILIGELSRWYISDVGMPLLASTLVSLAGRLLMPVHLQRGQLAVYVGLVSLTALTSAVVGTAQPRSFTLRTLRKFFP